MTAPAADLSRVVALVPIRGIETAKARLGEVLDAEERRALAGRLLRRTLRAAASAPGVALAALVSPDHEALDLATAHGAVALEESGAGLNAALDEGRAWARSIGATALLVLPADLPAIDARAVADIVARARAAVAGAGETDARPLVALVPDRDGSGTNALLLSPPGAIPFAFGPGSRAAHAAAAGRAGARYLELGGPLSLDLDLPDDLLLAGDPGRPGDDA